ncbi:hypothetical protein D3C71_2093640 [compost metagenome]
MNMTQPERVEDLRFHQVRRKRISERCFLILCRYLRIDTLIELGPQARNREKNRRLCPTQIRTEGLQAIVEKHMHAVSQ